MISAILRPHLAWWHDARENRLRPSAVGGVPIESFVASQPTCHDCDFTDPSGELVLHHMWAEHGRDRRRKDRRAAAA